MHYHTRKTSVLEQCSHRVVVSADACTKNCTVVVKKGIILVNFLLLKILIANFYH